jgi:uncharacterized membrane protein
MRRARAQGTSARNEVMTAGVLGLVVGLVAGVLAAPDVGALVGYDVAGVTYIAAVWLKVWSLSAEETAPLARSEDPTRGTADLILVGAALASLAAVGLQLARAGDSSGATEILRIALGLSAIVVSWVLVHTVFMIRYAGMYYGGAEGGIDFNQDEPPTFHDFAYLAFTIGMTYQVSDTAISSPEIRRIALRHAILSFLFGTGILATSINLVVALSS